MNRTELVAEVTAVAGEIAEVLDQNPLLAGPYPLREVRNQLAAHHERLHKAVRAYPSPLAVHPNGRPDKLGGLITDLMSYLEHVSVMYHALDDIPDHMRAQAGRFLGATHQQARRLRKAT